MSKLSTGENRHSMMGRPPPSPGAGKRASGLDPSTIHRMFPDAAAAIAKQKSEFTEVVGVPPASNRNSTIVGDRSSMLAPTISAPEEGNKRENAPPASPWNEGQSVQRPKSSGQQQQQQSQQSQQQPAMGQFTAPPPSAGLRSPRLPLQNDNTNVQTTTLNALEANSSGMPLLSPAYAPGGSWASQLSTPMVANFGQQANQADMVANATAMKLAALSTVNNRIQLDDVRKYRRARSTDGHGAGNVPMSPGFPPMGNNILMTNELGQVLTPQQAAALQAQQLASMNGRRSRPASPGIAMQGGMGGIGSFTSPQANGFLSADYANANMMSNGMGALNLGQFGLGGGFDNHNSGFLGDEINRGRSPRGRRGSSKPPEDPTDPGLLQDIPNWLRSLRLHKYTDNLKDLKWQELVELDDAGLEARGVNALGARRKMLKVRAHLCNSTSTINRRCRSLNRFKRPRMKANFDSFASEIPFAEEAKPSLFRTAATSSYRSTMEHPLHPAGHGTHRSVRSGPHTISRYMHCMGPDRLDFIVRASSGSVIYLVVMGLLFLLFQDVWLFFWCTVGFGVDGCRDGRAIMTMSYVSVLIFHCLVCTAFWRGGSNLWRLRRVQLSPLSTPTLIFTSVHDARHQDS